jgi:ferritin-like metal-binding protein YciE
MSQHEAVIAQYLREAHATELALVRVLQSQIAMAPRGDHRSALEAHLDETRSHAERVGHRLSNVERRGRLGVVRVGLDLAQGLTGQLIALSKTPLDLVRGTGGEEKVLKNAKDACATEALEIATYTTLERLARDAGDTATANLAASIRKDEEAMLQRLLDGLDDLTDAVALARLDGRPTFDPAKTGAADAARSAGAATKTAAKRSTAKAKRKVADKPA